MPSTLSLRYTADFLYAMRLLAVSGGTATPSATYHLVATGEGTGVEYIPYLLVGRDREVRTLCGATYHGVITDYPPTSQPCANCCRVAEAALIAYNTGCTGCPES